MTSVCAICMRPTRDNRSHPQCCKTLFGISTLPEIKFDLATLNAVAIGLVGQMSLSGVQRKVSAALSNDGRTLEPMGAGARFIVKPQSTVFQSLPENEHLTMCMARQCGLNVPPCGLFKLKDGSAAFVVRRFDRLPDGRKLQQEDFCQLANLPPSQKYNSTAQSCVALIREHATEPPVQVAALFRTFLFSWWCGNGDLHLKNLSVLTDSSQLVALSPAYDLLCTRLAIPNDSLALGVMGKRDNLHRKDWMRFANHSEIQPAAAERMIDSQCAHVTSCLELIDRSSLSEDSKDTYKALIAQRTQALAKLS